MAFALASCGGSAANSPQSTAWAPSDAQSRNWVLVTVHSARIAESLEAGTTWDADTRAALAEREENSANAIGTLIGLANPLAGTAFTALSMLSSDAPSDDASPTHPDPFVEVAWNADGEPRRHASGVFENNVRPVLDYPFLVRVSSLGRGSLDILVKDHDGDAAAPLIGEVSVPNESLLEVARSGDDVELVLHDHELLEISIRIRTVHREEIFDQALGELPLTIGLQPMGDVVPAGARVRVRASGNGTVGAGVACPPAVGPLGVADGRCRSYNLRVGSLPTAPHGSAVVLAGRSPDVIGFSLADIDPLSESPCLEFIAPASARILVGINDKDFRNNDGSFEFEVTFGVPPDDGPLETPGVPVACAAEARRQ